MSPGLAVIPVERYIGSCLISSVGYKKDRVYRAGYQCLPTHEYYQPWALLPANNNTNNLRRPKKEKEERSPLSRLAIHTQGAPLIQAQRHQGRKTVKTHGAKPQVQNQQEDTPNENSLPRIIKPRKRRKKDRKPQHTPETAIVTLKPYTPLCQEYNQPPSENKPVENEDKTSACWCRYCDPSGTVWDTPLSPHVVDDWPTLQVSSEIVTSPNGHRDIEIKFFSTPNPQQLQARSARRPSPPVLVTPPWQ